MKKILKRELWVALVTNIDNKLWFDFKQIGRAKQTSL